MFERAKGETDLLAGARNENVHAKVSTSRFDTGTRHKSKTRELGIRVRVSVLEDKIAMHSRPPGLKHNGVGLNRTFRSVEITVGNIKAGSEKKGYHSETSYQKATTGTLLKLESSSCQWSTYL